LIPSVEDNFASIIARLICQQSAEGRENAAGGRCMICGRMIEEARVKLGFSTCVTCSMNCSSIKKGNSKSCWGKMGQA
jgi:hypothetical protein